MNESAALTVERSVVIRASRPLVFRYFTDSKRFADWWGAGSSIESRVGGAVRIHYPGDTIATGHVVEIVPDERIVFTYGFEGPGHPIPPGGSRVEIDLADHERGTIVRLRHDVPSADLRDEFAQGWRFQLALFANVAAAEAHADAAARVDRWFAAWNEPDGDARRARWPECAAGNVTFADPYSCTRGIDDLNAHVSAGKVHMPGLTMARDGEVVHCQGTAVVRWNVRDASGARRASGTNWFEFSPEGEIERVVGYWNPPPKA